MHRPLIGITTNNTSASWGAWRDKPAVLLNEMYVRHVQRAGGDVLLIPPGNAGVACIEVLDGLMITGGTDVDPARYGAEPHPRTDRPHVTRDESEFALYAAARERDIPFFGICRGMQLMSIAEGGTLEQHVPDLGLGVEHVIPETIVAMHGASFTEGSLVAEILQTTSAEVNSAHHQCVRTAGTLTVTGWAQDGTIEVVEAPGARFALGVQWHPEMMDDTRLFDAFVAACRR